MEKIGMTCECGMEMWAPQEKEDALVEAVKFHVKTEHDMKPKNAEVRKMLQRVEEPMDGRD